jgi:hypothetical protein
VRVIERSDADIAAAAVDPREFTERLANQMAHRLVGVSVKHVIMPYAAFVAIDYRSGAYPQSLLAGVPTKVGAATLAALGDAIRADLDDANEAANWIGERLRDGAERAAPQAAGAIAGAVAGDGAAWAAATGVDLVGEAASWIDPDRASIGPLSGERGRAAARLIAVRIRQLAGLPLRPEV